MSKVKSLTSRQQFWAGHLDACLARGQALSSYAAEQNLSVAALYEAKSRLRRQGLWPTSSPRFVRVAVASSARETLPLLRVSLPNGVVVEGSAGAWSEVLSAAARLP